MGLRCSSTKLQSDLEYRKGQEAQAAERTQLYKDRLNQPTVTEIYENGQPRKALVEPRTGKVTPIGERKDPAMNLTAVRVYLPEGTTNSHLVVTPAGRIVVNTGLGFEGPVHKAYFDSVDSGPIRHVILAQGHVDHVGRTDSFLEPSTEVVAHARNPWQQADDLRVQPFRSRRAYFAWAAAIDGNRGTPGAQPPRQSRPEPTILVDDRLAFELGGVRVEVIACAGAETIDSLLVWLPAEGVLVTSNVFSALFGHFPNLGVRRRRSGPTTRSR